ncbi:hypothetical protein [Brevundimonas sp.]|jgi:hypothetical protein|uniref:hypothetical protein n=1 Tax=Brevundimonas sp. TaxID=1871086 RepID=UPI0037C03557
MTDARILHARSGALLEQMSGIEGEAYEVSSLRLTEPRTFEDLDAAERAFEAEVKASEDDPALMAMLGGA